MCDYSIIRSTRRTLAIEITRDGDVIVRAPLKESEGLIKKFVSEQGIWIAKKQELARKRKSTEIMLTSEEIDALKKKAMQILPGRVEYFTGITGLAAKSVKITSAKTRFGSCNGKNDICFSYFLMQYPENAIDYVVLHELAHTKHHNHGKLFWQTVARYMPDYAERQKILKYKTGVAR